MKKVNYLFAGAFALLLSGCGGQSVEVIDLNKVLDVVTQTFDQMDAQMGGKFQGNSEDSAAREKYMGEFNVKFAENLNNAKLWSKPIGTEVQTDGSVTGFNDTDKNMKLDGGEAKIFSIEVDMERNRLIATDLQNGYQRDHGFSMAGLAAGMLIGHLLSRQSAAGVTGSRFANRQMSPKNYHSAAVDRAKASARARSGSGSFSRGK